MPPVVFVPLTAKSLNRRAGFDLRRQLSNQQCPTAACVELAASTAACPRDQSDWVVRATQMGLNRRIAITAPILNSPANIARSNVSVARPQPHFGSRSCL